MISVDDDSVRGGGKRIDRFRGIITSKGKLLRMLSSAQQDSDLRKVMGTAARKMVQDRFAVEKEWAAYAEVYRELLS